MVVSVHQSRVIHLPNGIVLMPGANEVESKLFMEVSKHPSIVNLLNDSIISFDEPQKGKEEKAEDYLKSLSAREGLALIENTISTELLNKWLACEKRAQIKTAITKQLKALSAPVVLRSGETEEKTSGVHEELAPDFSKD